VCLIISIHFKRSQTELFLQKSPLRPYTLDLTVILKVFFKEEFVPDLWSDIKIYPNSLSVISILTCHQNETRNLNLLYLMFRLLYREFMQMSAYLKE